MNITYPIQLFTMSVCHYAQLKCTPLKKPTLKKTDFSRLLKRKF